MTKSEFIEQYELAWMVSQVHKPKFMIVAVRLPNDELELITNTESNMENKFQYYLHAYDDNMCLKASPNIQIVKMMIV